MLVSLTDKKKINNGIKKKKYSRKTQRAEKELI
jgi:hypothetical protein